MELSDLVVWRDRLWTCDDRSGIGTSANAIHLLLLLPFARLVLSSGSAHPRLVYEIYNETVIPTYVLTEGNGRTSKGTLCSLDFRERLCFQHW